MQALLLSWQACEWISTVCLRARQCPTARLSATERNNITLQRSSATLLFPSLPISRVVWAIAARRAELKGAGSGSIGEPQDPGAGAAVWWTTGYSCNVVPVVDVSGGSSLSTVSSCLAWTCLLVFRRPRTWAIRRENWLLFCLPADKCMNWGGEVRMWNVLMGLRCAAAFAGVNAKLISTLQHFNCPWLGLHVQAATQMKWVEMCEIKFSHTHTNTRKPQPLTNSPHHIQSCRKSGLKITTGDKCHSTKHSFLCENGSQAASVSLRSFHCYCLLEAWPSRC